jgi:hypothetical protein
MKRKKDTSSAIGAGVPSCESCSAFSKIKMVLGAECSCGGNYCSYRCSHKFGLIRAEKWNNDGFCGAVEIRY